MSRLHWRPTKKGGLWRKNYDGLLVVIFKKSNGTFNYVCDSMFSKESYSNIEQAKEQAEEEWCIDDINESRHINKVYCEIFDGDSENEHGVFVPSVTAVCPKCQHETISFGLSKDSITRCLALLHSECPLNENNFYIGSKL